MVLFVPSMSVMPASRGRRCTDSRNALMEKLWPDLARTARWLSPQPGQPTWASRARVSVWKETKSQYHILPSFVIPINPFVAESPEYLRGYWKNLIFVLWKQSLNRKEKKKVKRECRYKESCKVGKLFGSLMHPMRTPGNFQLLHYKENLLMISKKFWDFNCFIYFAIYFFLHNWWK